MGRDRHPEHAATLRCKDRDGGPVYSPDGVPGFTGTPCRCKFWMDLSTVGDSSTAAPPRRVQGCLVDLVPFIATGPVVKATLALAAVEALRLDVQQAAAAMREETGELRRELVGHVVGGLNRIGAAVVGGLAQLTARAGVSLLATGESGLIGGLAGLAGEDGVSLAVAPEQLDLGPGDAEGGRGSGSNGGQAAGDGDH